MECSRDLLVQNNNLLALYVKLTLASLAWLGVEASLLTIYDCFSGKMHSAFQRSDSETFLTEIVASWRAYFCSYPLILTNPQT